MLDELVTSPICIYAQEKSATYRQYLGNRLFYNRVKDLYRKYGLLEETNTEEKEAD